ncbi:MAG: FAD-dependent oxidoreductase [Novosphingobium sp.]
MSAQTDVLVIGSGAAGLTAALTAALHGRHVILIEAAERVGGMTAGSGGAMWLPANPLMAAAGIVDTPELAHTHIAAHLGDLYDRDMIDAFLKNGSAMVGFLQERSSAMRFISYAGPDYHQNLPGAQPSARSLMPQYFDGRLLGPWLARMEGPKRELTVFGGMQVEASEALELQQSWRRLSAFNVAARLVGRYALDRARFGRGTRLIRGQALVGRLLRSALDAGVTIRPATRATSLLQRAGKVCGAIILTATGEDRIEAGDGVILATGGFSSDPERVNRFFPDAAMHIPMFPATNRGEGVNLAESVGGSFGRKNADNGIWMPASAYRRADGTMLRYPHFAFDRCKPGAVVVNAHGRRFVNEGGSYHAFVRAMRLNDAVPAWLVGDHPFLREYGMGLARPFPYPYRPLVRNGYLVQARTIAELAGKIRVPADALEDTIVRMNRYAQTGSDEEFGKGDDIHSRMLGDARRGPNPTLGPIATAPFYALALYPSDAGTTLGLRTNTNAQVLDDAAMPIPGLYACGLDMNSALRGHYPGAGTMLGPAMAFAYAAGRHTAGAA